MRGFNPRRSPKGPRRNLMTSKVDFSFKGIQAIGIRLKIFTMRRLLAESTNGMVNSLKFFQVLWSSE
jgi:hypothetical protein